MEHEIEKLLDRLASKELTFGCRLERNDMEEVIALGTPVSGIGPKFDAVSVIYTYRSGENKEWRGIGKDSYSISTFKILGHPIRIGDVLDKIRWRAAPKFWKEAEPLIEIWGDVKVGFTKSLQEIFAGAEWEEVCSLCGKVPPCGCGSDKMERIQVPKQPAIRELFECLLSLGL